MQLISCSSILEGSRASVVSGATNPFVAPVYRQNHWEIRDSPDGTERDIPEERHLPRGARWARRSRAWPQAADPGGDVIPDQSGHCPPGDSIAGGAVGESGARIRKGARIARGARAVVPDDTVSGPAGGLGFP